MGVTENGDIKKIPKKYIFPPKPQKIIFGPFFDFFKTLKLDF